MSKLSLKVLLGVFGMWFWLIAPSISAADPFAKLELQNYGSFLHTERIPNALFFFSDIENNDSFELRKALRNHKIDTLVLSSKGGSVWEGLNMAGIIFDKKLKTYVPSRGIGDEGNCASACSFMFFGGSTRIADGKLGVHQFFSETVKKSADIEKTERNAQFTVSEIIGFLNEFSTPPFVFERMFERKEMYYFSKSELQEINRIVDPISIDELSKIKGFILDFNTKLSEFSDEQLIKEKPPLEVTQRQIIKDIQIELERLNCGAGEADGIIGNKTRTALKRFGIASGQVFHEEQLIDQEFLLQLKTTNFKCQPILQGALVCDQPSDETPSNEELYLTKMVISNWDKRKDGSEHKVMFCSSSGCVDQKLFHKGVGTLLSSRSESYYVTMWGWKEEGKREKIFYVFDNNRPEIKKGRYRTVFKYADCKEK